MLTQTYDFWHLYSNREAIEKRVLGIRRKDPKQSAAILQGRCMYVLPYHLWILHNEILEPALAGKMSINAQHCTALHNATKCESRTAGLSLFTIGLASS
jgi:hypothetical protein